MFVQPIFKSKFGQSYVVYGFTGLVVGDFGSVNDTFTQALSLERAQFFLPTVAIWCVVFWFGVEDLAVMGLDNG